MIRVEVEGFLFGVVCELFFLVVGVSSGILVFVVVDNVEVNDVIINVIVIGIGNGVE